jgi:hypothetical protein
MGSPSFLMVEMYILVSMVAGSKAIRHGFGRQGLKKRRIAGIWFALAVYLLLLALTRHFHLHESVYNYIRGLALQEGWYELRRPVQSAALVLLFFLGSGSLIGYWVNFQNHYQELRILSLAGVVILTSIWLLRTISFHYTDSFIHFNLGFISVSSIIELSGLLAILLAGFKPIPLHK